MLCISASVCICMRTCVCVHNYSHLSLPLLLLGSHVCVCVCVCVCVWGELHLSTMSSSHPPTTSARQDLTEGVGSQALCARTGSASFRGLGDPHCMATPSACTGGGGGGGGQRGQTHDLIHHSPHPPCPTPTP